MSGEGIETLGKDLFLPSSDSDQCDHSDQSEIQKTFRDPPPPSQLSSSSYRDLGFRETFIAENPEPGGTSWSGSGFSSGLGFSDRRTLLPPHEKVHHPQLPPEQLVGHLGEFGNPGGHLGHPSHPASRLPSVSPRIQLNPVFDSRCPT